MNRLLGAFIAGFDGGTGADLDESIGMAKTGARQGHVHLSPQQETPDRDFNIIFRKFWILPCSWKIVVQTRYFEVSLPRQAFK